MEKEKINPTMDNTCQVETFKNIVFRDGAYFVEEVIALRREATDAEREERIKCGFDKKEWKVLPLTCQALNFNQTKP